MLGGDAQSMMVAACPRQGRTWRRAGIHFKLGRTGLPDGLDMRDEGKGGSKDDSQVCEPESVLVSFTEMARLGEKQVWGHEVGCFPWSHTQAWDRENSSVCQQSHQPYLLFKWSLCVLFVFNNNQSFDFRGSLDFPKVFQVLLIIMCLEQCTFLSTGGRPF